MNSFLSSLRKLDSSTTCQTSARMHSGKTVAGCAKGDRATVKNTDIWFNGYRIGRQIGLACLLPTISLLAPSFSRSVQAQTPPTYCSNLYAIDNSGASSSKIYNVNVSNTTYNLATANSGSNATNTIFLSAAAAIEPTTGKIFYISRETTGTRVAYWNPVTNTHTQITTAATAFDSNATVVRAAFSPSGRLFGATSTFLFEVNPTTGALLASKPLSGVSGLNGDMAFDGNNVLFLAADANLYTIDVNNLSATTPANLLGTAPAGTTFNSLGFKQDGKLYAFAGSNSNMYEVNTNTGNITSLGVITFNPTTGAGVVGTDFASCAAPTPTLISEKTYAKFSGSTGSTYAPGDVIEYTVTTTNTGLVPTTNSKFQDPVPAGTTYVAGSTTMNGLPVTDATGAVFPFAVAKSINSTGLNPGVIGFGTTYQVIIKYRIRINTVAPPTSVTNQGTTFYLGGPTTGVPSDDPNTTGTDPTVTPVTVNISGTVFEDPNYGGGVGRNLATANTSPRNGAVIELYKSDGTYISSTTTAGGGKYSFSIPVGNYYVRAVNSTVTSSRPGVGAISPVQTFRTDVSTGTVTANLNKVGGEKPAAFDTGAAATGAQLNTTNFTFTTGAGSAVTNEQAESVTPVTVGATAITGIDFGYNFDTIVNTNDAGQGSLRQFITNSNILGGEASLAQVGNRKDKLNTNQPLPTGVETSIFMIPSNADPLGRAKDPKYDITRGVAQIIPLTLLPTVTGANANSTSIDGTTQTANIGNNNAGVLGRGGKVGVGQLTLNQVQRPEIEIFGNNQFNGANDRALKADGVADFTVRGLATYNFYTSIEANNATRPTVEQNILGTKADSWADPGANRDIHKNLLFNTGTQSGLVQNNLLGFTTNSDALTFVGTTTSTITNNDCQAGAVGTGAVGDCYTLYDGNTNNIIRGNLATDISASGIDVLRGSNNNLIENNTVRNAGTGGVETAGIRVTDYSPTPLLPSNSNIIKRNIVTGSVGSGILVTSGLSNTITENSLYANGKLGIDLLKSDELAARDSGVTPYITANDGLIDSSAANNDIDYPIITSTKLDATGTLRVAGYVGKPVNVANFGNAKLEFFIADNSPANQNGEVILGDGKSKPHGEGRTFIGSCNALSDSKFSCTFANAGALGLTDANNITATATDSNGNTSEFSSVLANPANLVLVKRITAIKDAATNTTTTFNSFVDDGTTNNLLPGWTVGTGSYLLGALNNGAVKVKPGDEVEYTIYYLNSGGSPITKARVCDRLNKSLVFQTQFSTTTTANQGIEFTKDTITSYPTNTATDNDPGFYSISSTLPINCNLTGNTTFDANNISDNIVVVDVARIADLILGVVSDPLTGGQRGYVKFKAKVQQ